jgi:hypothetical protein
MPLPKRQTIAKASAKETSKPKPSPKPSSSGRFDNFETDPKFRLPSKKHAKTKLDPRFARLRTDPDFQSKTAVDRYGRRTEDDAGAKVADRFYASDDEDGQVELETPKTKKRDEAVRRKLAKAQGLDPIRDGGLSSSSEESSDDEDVEVEDEAELAGEGNEVPMGDVTARLAAVNLDWDNVRAADIMAVANSFVPAEGSILNVVVRSPVPEASNSYTSRGIVDGKHTKPPLAELSLWHLRPASRVRRILLTHQ